MIQGTNGGGPEKVTDKRQFLFCRIGDLSLQGSLCEPPHLLAIITSHIKNVFAIPQTPQGIDGIALEIIPLLKTQFF